MRKIYCDESYPATVQDMDLAGLQLSLSGVTIYLKINKKVKFASCC